MTIVLKNKFCSECGNKVPTFARNPLCQICMKKKCELSHMKDNINRNICNTVSDLICRTNCLCVGHYKMILEYCYVCGEAKEYNENISYDGYYYCKNHKPVDQSYMIHKLLDNDLNYDVVSVIISKLD